MNSDRRAFINSQPSSRTCCCFFDIKNGASVALVIDLVLWVLLCIIPIANDEYRPHGTAAAKEEVEIFIWGIVVAIINVIGIYSIKKGKTSLLIPCLICKVMAIGLVILFIIMLYTVPFFAMVLMQFKDWVVMMFPLYIVWLCYSTVVLYKCYKEMFETMRMDGPDGSQPYTRFQAVGYPQKSQLSNFA